MAVRTLSEINAIDDDIDASVEAPVRILAATVRVTAV
jgi:hypothetical protein